MKAIQLRQGGGTEQLYVAEREIPGLRSDDQVVVRLKAAGINPIDTKIRTAPERFPVTLPAVLGCDGAGVIEAIGESIADFKVGDEVYFCQCGFNGRQGTYGEYALVDSCFLAHKPTSLSFVEAAAVPLALITAWEALYDRVKIEPGMKVLIHGGAGGVGHIALQLAKLAGAEVAVTISNDEKGIFASSLGADRIINYRQQNFVTEALDWSEGEGVDIVLDTVGGGLIEQSFDCTKVYGDLITILQPPEGVNWGAARKRNLRFTQELMLTPTMLEMEEAKQHQGAILQQAASLFDDGQLRICVAACYPLQDVAQAHQYLEQQHPIGKVVLTLSGDSLAKAIALPWCLLA